MMYIFFGKELYKRISVNSGVLMHLKVDIFLQRSSPDLPWLHNSCLHTLLGTCNYSYHLNFHTRHYVDKVSAQDTHLSPPHRSHWCSLRIWGKNITSTIDTNEKTAEFTNSVDPDQMPHNVPSDQCWHCLSSILWTLKMIKLDKTIIGIFAEVKICRLLFGSSAVIKVPIQIWKQLNL